MSLSSAKAKLDAQPGDPATGYISKQDHKDSYDELVADTALTGATTAQDLTVNGRDVDNLIAGPASATDNALVRFDGTGGKTAQNSGIVVDDSNNVTGMGTLASGAVTSSGAVQAAAGSGFVVGSSGPIMRSGTGSPEGAVTARVGSLWLQTDGGVGTAVWAKQSGTGNTGWIQVMTQSVTAVPHPINYYGTIGSGPVTFGAGPLPSSQGDCFLYPFMNPHALTISEVRLRVSSAAAAGASWRLGVYQASASTTLPDTLVGDFGTVDPTTTGVKSVTGLSVVLPAGLLWQAIALQGSGAGGGAVYGQTSALPVKHTSSLSATYNGLKASSVTGALPNPVTVSGNNAGVAAAIPLFEYRRSA